MKKILISNGCVGSCIYRDCVKIPQPSPFVWNVIPQEDFIKLIKNIDTLNLLNFKVVFDTLCQEYYVLIDNLVKIYYTHYKHDPDAKENHVSFVPGHGHMINCPDVIGYISDEYIKRVNRLLEARQSEGVEFIFYYDSGCFQPWAETIDSYVTRKHDELFDLANIETKHTICVGYWNWWFLDELKEKNPKILYFPKPYNKETRSILTMEEEAEYVYNHYLKELMDESTETKEILD